jgi:uncharacterized protein (TIGR02145 family)
MKNKTIYAFNLVVLLQAILFSVNAQTLNSTVPNESGIRRNATYNLEEIKVRWKKAALENCPGVPCVVAPPPPAGPCPSSTITDFDGNIYNTVSIGTQCWTKQNLRTTHYTDGTPIPLNTSGTGDGNPGENWSTKTTGERTVYLHNSINETNYGYLYNGYALKGISLSGSNKSICPTGWHVPTDAEWIVLENHLGGKDFAAGKAKALSTLWTSGSNPGNNESGFSALPGGWRAGSDNPSSPFPCTVCPGRFREVVDYAYFWTSSENIIDNSRLYGRYFYYNSLATDKSSYYKSSGLAIRCIKDQVGAQ